MQRALHASAALLVLAGLAVMAFFVETSGAIWRTPPAVQAGFGAAIAIIGGIRLIESESKHSEKVDRLEALRLRSERLRAQLDASMAADVAELRAVMQRLSAHHRGVGNADDESLSIEEIERLIAEAPTDADRAEHARSRDDVLAPYHELRRNARAPA